MTKENENNTPNQESFNHEMTMVYYQFKKEMTKKRFSLAYANSRKKLNELQFEHHEQTIDPERIGSQSENNSVLNKGTFVTNREKRSINLKQRLNEIDTHIVKPVEYLVPDMNLKAVDVKELIDFANCPVYQKNEMDLSKSWSNISSPILKKLDYFAKEQRFTFTSPSIPEIKQAVYYSKESEQFDVGKAVYDTTVDAIQYQAKTENLKKYVPGVNELSISTAGYDKKDSDLGFLEEKLHIEKVEPIEYELKSAGAMTGHQIKINSVQPLNFKGSGGEQKIVMSDVKPLRIGQTVYHLKESGEFNVEKGIENSTVYAMEYQNKADKLEKYLPKVNELIVNTASYEKKYRDSGLTEEELHIENVEPIEYEQKFSGAKADHQIKIDAVQPLSFIHNSVEQKTKMSDVNLVKIRQAVYYAKVNELKSIGLKTDHQIKINAVQSLRFKNSSVEPKIVMSDIKPIKIQQVEYTGNSADLKKNIPVTSISVLNGCKHNFSKINLETEISDLKSINAQSVQYNANTFDFMGFAEDLINVEIKKMESPDLSELDFSKMLRKSIARTEFPKLPEYEDFTTLLGNLGTEIIKIECN